MTVNCNGIYSPTTLWHWSIIYLHIFSVCAEISMQVFGVIVNCSQYSADTAEQWKCPGDSGYCRTCSGVGTHVGSAVAQQGLRSAGIFTGIAQ